MGKKYIATEGKGIAILDKNENWSFIDTDNSKLPSGYIPSILIDKNIIWIGTQNAGLVRIENLK